MLFYTDIALRTLNLGIKHKILKSDNRNSIIHNPYFDVKQRFAVLVSTARVYNTKFWVRFQLTFVFHYETATAKSSVISSPSFLT